MSDPIVTTFATLTSVGGESIVVAPSGDHTLAISLAGAGAVAATVDWLGSNDLSTWVLIAQMPMSGTNGASAGASTTLDYAYWKLRANSLTGTSVAGAVASQAASRSSSIASITPVAAGVALLASVYAQVMPLDIGQPDGVALYDATTTASANSVIGSSSYAGKFRSTDIGKTCVVIPYTDTGTTARYGTIIAVAADGSTCTTSLSGSPGALTNATFIFGTDYGPKISNALAAAALSPTRAVLQLPLGIMCSTLQHVQPTGVTVRGFANNATGGKAKDFRHYGSSVVATNFFAAGAFWKCGDAGVSDPRGTTLEYLNIDSANLHVRTIDCSSARTAVVTHVTGVRGVGETYYGGPTDHTSYCTFLGSNNGNVAVVSGDGMFTHNKVIGAGTTFACIKCSNPTDVVIKHNHVWHDSANSAFTGYGIWVSFNSGVTNSCCVDIEGNKIDTTYGHAYYISASGNAVGRGVSIRGGVCFNNDNVTNNTGSILGLSIASGSSLKGLLLRDVNGAASFNDPSKGQWAYLVDNSASAGTIVGFSTGGCVVSGCNALYSNITPDVDDVNIVMVGTGTALTKSTRI